MSKPPTNATAESKRSAIRRPNFQLAQGWGLLEQVFRQKVPELKRLSVKQFSSFDISILFHSISLKVTTSLCIALHTYTLYWCSLNHLSITELLDLCRWMMNKHYYL